MNILNTFLAASVVAVISLASAHSYGQPAAGNSGNPAAGNSGNPAASCVACHGAKGEGNVQMNAPRIAGQPQAYLARQLAAYANGGRNNPVMAPIAKQLTPRQISAVSAHYAAQAAPASKSSPKASAKNQQRAQSLATIGDEKIGVQACANCHGPGGDGEPPVYPYLAGQHGGYLSTALGEWKSGARNTDPSQQMNTIAKRLNDNDIRALASYYAAQSPPAPQRTNVPMGSAARPTSPGTTTQGSSTPVTGTGTEQGAPSSGGDQGPGGGGGGGASGSGPSGTPKGGR